MPPVIVRIGGVLLALAAFGLLHGGCGGSAEPIPSADASVDVASEADSVDSAEAADASDTSDGAAQCPVRQPLWEFIYANKACTTASDCVVAKTCFTQAEGCGGVLAGLYLSSSYDATKLGELEASLSAQGDACCYVPGCDYVVPSFCWKQTCLQAVGDGDQASRDKCYDLLDRTTQCATCVCANHGRSCNQNAGCMQLLQCAHDKGCLGSTKCAPDNPASPCKALAESLGGPSSQSVALFAAVNDLLPLTGCDIPCAKP